MKRLSIIAVLTACVMVTSATAQIYTSRQGYRFEVKLLLQKDVIMLGEPIYMDFQVKNLSAVDFGIAEGGDYRNELGRPESFEVLVKDLSGKLVEQPKIGMSFGGLVGFRKCPAGKECTFRLYLPHWATFDSTGDYEITVSRHLVVREYAKAFEYFEESGSPAGAKATIKVIPNDKDLMGQLVESLGKNLLDQDETATRLVPFILDERIIPFLAQAIQKNPVLTRSLSKFASDDALKAILSRINDADSEVRRYVSVALRGSVHPKSKEYLIAMRHDSNRGVRLDVVQYLGTRDDEVSIRILTEMANDADQQMVGSEAKRYLKERGKTPK